MTRSQLLLLDAGIHGQYPASFCNSLSWTWITHCSHLVLLPVIILWNTSLEFHSLTQATPPSLHNLMSPPASKLQINNQDLSTPASLSLSVFIVSSSETPPPRPHVSPLVILRFHSNLWNVIAALCCVCTWINSHVTAFWPWKYELAEEMTQFRPQSLSRESWFGQHDPTLQFLSNQFKNSIHKHRILFWRHSRS